jgi:hypothetical protein
MFSRFTISNVLKRFTPCKSFHTGVSKFITHVRPISAQTPKPKINYKHVFKNIYKAGLCITTFIFSEECLRNSFKLNDEYKKILKLNCGSDHLVIATTCSLGRFIFWPYATYQHIFNKKIVNGIFGKFNLNDIRLYFIPDGYAMANEILLFDNASKFMIYNNSELKKKIDAKLLNKTSKSIKNLKKCFVEIIVK